MNIVDYHIDERLVHGEVSTSWIPYMDIDRVIVIDNYSAASEMMKQIFRISIQSNIYLSVLTEEKAITNLRNDKYGNQKLFLITNNFDIYLKLHEAGIPVTEISVGIYGHAHKEETMIRASNKVNLSSKDVATLKKLNAAGIRAYGRINALIKDKTDLYEAATQLSGN